MIDPLNTTLCEFLKFCFVLKLWNVSERCIRLKVIAGFVVPERRNNIISGDTCEELEWGLRRRCCWRVVACPSDSSESRADTVTEYHIPLHGAGYATFYLEFPITRHLPIENLIAITVEYTLYTFKVWLNNKAFTIPEHCYDYAS